MVSVLFWLWAGSIFGLMLYNGVRVHLELKAIYSILVLIHNRLNEMDAPGDSPR